jgi:hypothetical protein
MCDDMLKSSFHTRALRSVWEREFYGVPVMFLFRLRGRATAQIVAPFASRNDHLPSTAPGFVMLWMWTREITYQTGGRAAPLFAVVAEFSGGNLLKEKKLLAHDVLISSGLPPAVFLSQIRLVDLVYAAMHCYPWHYWCYRI